MGPIGCIGTSVRNYQYTLSNNPEGRSSHGMTLFFSLEGQGTLPYKIHQRVKTTLSKASGLESSTEENLKGRNNLGTLE
jgi:hypothetical protein